MDQPFWCKSNGEDDESEDDESEDDEGEDDESKDDGKTSDDGKLFPKPASEYPEHKWVCLWATWEKLLDTMRYADHRNPDSFGMYIYNDFHWYGIAELVENLVRLHGVPAVWPQADGRSRSQSSRQQRTSI